MKKKTLVFGASLKPDRYSYLALQRLIHFGHQVVGFGLEKGEIGGITIDTELQNYADIDTVSMYLRAEYQEFYYDYLIGLNPKRILFNPGTENAEFYKLLQHHNIEYEVACTLVLLSTNQY